jgi:photosystem II stability/assembly factor-like uncharacterized protein
MLLLHSTTNRHPMRKGIARYLWMPSVAIVLLFTVQCRRQETFELRQWAAQSVPVNVDLTSIQATADGRGWISGGQSYQSGCLLSTTDGGQNWILDTLLPFRMEAISLDPDQQAFAFGQWGTGYYWRTDVQRWENFMTEFRWFRAGSVPSSRRAIVVGGESFAKGEMQVNGPNDFWRKDTVLSLPEQLMAVWANSDSVAHVAGMGCLYRSTNVGRTWQRLPVTDDLFIDVQFTDSLTGYCAGQHGSLFKTTDGGLHWSRVSDSQTLGRNRKVVRSIWFYSATGGWLAGDNGLLCHTTDGGSTWAAAAQPDSDLFFRDVVALPDGRGWVVGENGAVYYFEWD